MEFEFVVVIHRSPTEVFVFFRDVDRYAGRKGSLVPAYDKVTPGPVGAGTQYREVVQILPFVTGVVLTELVVYEPECRLVYRYMALGMPGELAYRFEGTLAGTRVVQQQSLRPGGLLRWCSPVIRVLFSWMAGRRLRAIKEMLEDRAQGGDGPD